MVRHILVIATLGWLGCSAGNETPSLQLLDDMEFLGFVDIDTDTQPRTIRLSDYTAENRPGTRIIMLNAAAGWCAPCMREASAMPAFAAAYEPRGVAILTAVFQDQNGDPADAEFVRTWVETFDLPVPALIDSTFQTGRYFDASAMPANMFVDAETLDILAIAEGAAAGSDPMREYRELLDHYLE
jgi:thiol-disulfide isomerase/thioredoxin